MYLLDSDIIVWIIRGDKEIINIIENLGDSKSTQVSTITIAEIYKNVFPAEVTKTDECIYHHGIINVDDKIAKEAGLYWQQYHKKLKTLSLADCLIAATAKNLSFTLITFNTRHYPMTDIKVLNPLKMVN